MKLFLLRQHYFIDLITHCVRIGHVDGAKIPDRKIELKNFQASPNLKKLSKEGDLEKLLKIPTKIIFEKAVVTMLAQNGA